MLLVALIGLNTALSRFLPFWIFAKSTPAYIAMLIVYCLKDTDLSQYPYGLNEIVAVCVVVGIHTAFKIPVLNIICGTITYMLLVQSDILNLL